MVFLPEMLNAAPAGKSEFSHRVYVLGISIAELAQISGYSPKTLYNVSSNHQRMTTQLDAFLKLLEALHGCGILPTVLGMLEAPARFKQRRSGGKRGGNPAGR